MLTAFFRCMLAGEGWSVGGYGLLEAHMREHLVTLTMCQDNARCAMHPSLPLPDSFCAVGPLLVGSLRLMPSTSCSLLLLRMDKPDSRLHNTSRSSHLGRDRRKAS